MVNKRCSLTAELGKTIRTKRKDVGMTQEELAEKIGISHQSLSRIENGSIAPKMYRLPLIAESLKCTVADLFRNQKHASTSYAERIDDLFSGLVEMKKEFVYQHLTQLIFLLKLDE